MRTHKYLFGPVASRRFGRSLGVDLLPLKTCTLDCVFCQLGRASSSNPDRGEYVPTQDVLAELDYWLHHGGQADFITLSGSGEPTLHTRFGEVLDFIKAQTLIRSLLLTNGTLLHMPEVRQAACVANVVKVSLSAWDQASFERVNRPAAGITFDKVLQGERDFRSAFSGELWMEVFVLSGINSAPRDMDKIARLAGEIGPDRIQLNTVARPPADEFALAVPREEMESLSRLFEPPAEVIAEYRAAHKTRRPMATEAVLAMLRRRPCTAEQIAEAFDLQVSEVAKCVGELLKTNKIRENRRQHHSYYIALDE